MSRLIGFELEKICRRKIVWAGLVALIGLNLVFYIFTAMPSMGVMNDQGGYSKGAGAIAVDRELTKPYEGVLTDDTVKQILLDHQEKIEKTDFYARMDYAYDSVGKLFLDETGNYNGLSVKELYGADSSHREFHYARGEQQFLGYMPMLLLVMGYFLIVALSPVFSDEYMRGTDALILTSKMGKKQCAISKVTASLIFTAVVAGVVILLNWLLMVLFFGTEGWSMSIQLEMTAGDYSGVPYAMTMGQTISYAVLLWMTAMCGLTGIVVICSSFAKSSFMALITALLIYTIPLTLSSLSFEWLQRILSFMPVIMSTVGSVLQFPLVELGGFAFNFSCLPMLTMAAVCILSFVVTKRVFRRKMV